MSEPAADTASLDDGILGGFLLLGDVPDAYRPRLRAGLFAPSRRRTAEAMLAVKDRLGICPPRPLEEELARLGAGIPEIFALRGLVPNAALPDELPDLIDALERRASREAAARAPVATLLSEILDGLLEQIKAGPPKCVPTPFPTLNRFLGGGFAPGELVYLGAYPGVGKSAFALELARHAAKASTCVLIVSAEMVTLALVRRLLAQEARVRATSLKTGRVGDGEWVLLGDAIRRLQGLPVWLTDQARTLAQIQTLAQGLPELGFLIVDYLQLIEGQADSESRRQEIEGVSKGLKRLAVSLGIPVLALSSLPYPPDGRQGEPPMRLKESSGLNHDGDVILLLHRREDEPETTCRVAKNRDGETGKAMLRFRAEYVTFEEAERREE